LLERPFRLGTDTADNPRDILAQSTSENNCTETIHGINDRTDKRQIPNLDF